MNIALVDGTQDSKLYPLPLLKLGAWQKDIGNQVALFNNGKLPQADEYDEIWVTTRFTFDIPFATGLVREAKKRARRVWVGGISASLLPDYFRREGVDVHVGLLPEAEQYAPDYSLLGHDPDYSISHTSRGCIRKCGFCMVTKLEPQFTHRSDWEKDIHPNTKKVLFYDNNWLGKSKELLQEDIDKLKGLVKAGRITEIDFNQGLDARLVDDAMADRLTGLPIRPIRFAFDGKQEDGYYQRAIHRMYERGYHSFMTYVLYNFTDTPQDFYYRLKESVKISQELKIAVDSFPMRYQPILEVNKQRDYVGKHWTLEGRRGFKAILGCYTGMAGTVTSHSHNTYPPLEEFEYWMGENADEFVRLINYPKIRELSNRKKGELRMKRAERRKNEALE